MIEILTEYINYLILLAIAVGGGIVSSIIVKKFSLQGKIAQNPTGENYENLRKKYLFESTTINENEESKILLEKISNKKTKQLIISLFVCLITILLFIFISTTLKNSKEIENQSFLFDKNTPFEKIQDEYKILILPFSYKKNYDFELESRLKDRFDELIKDKKLNLAVKFINNKQKVIAFEDAEKIGKKFNADIVIFGDFDIDAKKVKLCYVVVNKIVNEMNDKNKTEFVRLDGVSDISQGYLQEDVDGIIYWTLGMQALKKKEYQKALEHFDNISYEQNFVGEAMYNAMMICYIKTMDRNEIMYFEKYFLYFDLAYFCGQYLFDNELVIELYINELNYFNQSAATLNNLAVTYKNNGDYQSAETYFKSAIKQDKNALYFSNLAYLYTNDFFKNYSLSEKLYLEAIRLDSLNPEYYNNLGDLYCLDSLKKYDKAKKYYLKAIKVNSEHLQSYFNIAYLEINYNNNFDSAKYYLDKAQRIDKENSDVYYNYGDLYQYHTKNFGKAKDYYEKAIKFDGTNAAAYKELGDIYFYNYKIYKKEAEENYRIALSISPNNSSFYNALGLLLLDKKNYNESLTCFQSALSQKNISNKSKSIYLANCGDVYKNQKKYLEAEKYYLQALEYNEDRFYTNFQLYYLYDKIGEYEKAMKYYKNACKINPKYKHNLYIVSLWLKQLFSGK